MALVCASGMLQWYGKKKRYKGYLELKFFLQFGRIPQYSQYCSIIYKMMFDRIAKIFILKLKYYKYCSCFKVF